jgi:GT2 family glycosyltransferase
VVLNYNGGDHVVRCVQALVASEWPADALDVVVVDNASTDGSTERIEAELPQVRIIRNPRNDGFPANNLAMRDLDDVDVLALVNNDAFVEPDWLPPLVAALDEDPTLGAACPILLFAPSFVDVRLEADEFVPGAGDPRRLGVRVSGVERVASDGTVDDVWALAQLAEGFWGVEQGPGEETRFQWSHPEALVRAPVEAGRPVDGALRLRLAASRPTQVVLRCGGAVVEAGVHEQPSWVEVPLSGEPYDVVQNAGSVLVEGGWGADRGFLAPDGPEWRTPAEVFSWCGGGVALRTAYLEEVGLFDERFFLYYEDTDLAWRGRLRGWRYRTCPDSVLRHLHAATSGEGSPLFQHYTERNRLVMLARNAPTRLAFTAPLRFLTATASYTKRDVVAPVLRGHRPNLGLVRRRLRAFLGYLRLLPAMLASRRSVRRGARLSDAEVLAWMVTQDEREDPARTGRPLESATSGPRTDEEAGAGG